MKKLSLFGGLIFLAAGGSAAAVDFVPCDNCFSQSMRSQAAANSFKTHVYVVDRPNAVIERYFVERVDIPGEYAVFATRVPNDPVVEQQFMDVAIALNSLESSPVLVPPSVYADGINLGCGTAVCAQARDVTFSWLAQSVPIVYQAAAAFSGRTILVEMRFADGSTWAAEIEIKANLSSVTGTLTHIEVIPESGRLDGEIIPVDNVGFVGFGVSGRGRDLEDWIDYVTSMGIPVVSGSPFGRTLRCQMDCDVDGCTITCEVP